MFFAPGGYTPRLIYFARSGLSFRIALKGRHLLAGGVNPRTYYNNVRGSVITPVTAAAAATKGEAKTVRAPGP